VQVPRAIYGTYKEVNARARKAVTRINRGEDWTSLMDESDMVDTARLSGLLVLSGPSPLLSASLNFHCFLPMVVLQESISLGQLPLGIEDKAFESSLHTAWGTLGLLCPPNRVWVYQQERYRRLVRATFHFWQTLESEGERYTVGSATGQRLWSIGSNFKYALANLGVPMSTLNSPLPESGPANLISMDQI
jgi:hypothetical protein